MLGIGDKLPAFEITGVKPGFNEIDENGDSAFEAVSETSFPGKWKVIFFYPKDFTFVCPTEIAEFARLSKEFAERNAIVLGGSTDNEFVKLAWRRDHKDLDRLPIWQFADARGDLVDGLGVRAPSASPIASRSLSIRIMSSSMFTRRTLMSVGRRRIRCGSLTRCRQGRCAPATGLLAAKC